MYVRTYICMYMYVCTYVCTYMYVRTYVRMYVCICIYMQDEYNVRNNNAKDPRQAIYSSEDACLLSHSYI